MAVLAAGIQLQMFLSKKLSAGLADILPNSILINFEKFNTFI